MKFELHPQLEKDSRDLGEFQLSRVLLMNDCRYPWLVLVPQRPDISEIYQLSETDQLQLHKESVYLCEQMATFFKADKMNTAALGNVVPQLHLHHVARFKTDATWPAPIWGRGEANPYTGDALTTLQGELQKRLNLD